MGQKKVAEVNTLDIIINQGICQFVMIDMWSSNKMTDRSVGFACSCPCPTWDAFLVY